MLVPWKKSYDQPRQHIKKQSHYFTNKGLSVKAMVFPVVMYGCDSWTIKKAENWRIDAFEVVLEKTLESFLDCKEIQPVYPKGNQSWIFIGRTDVEAETVILLATWCKERTHWKRPWCWERLKGRGERVDRGWDGWTASPTQWTWVGVSSRSWWWTGKPGVLQSMGSQRVKHNWATELNWTELNKIPSEADAAGPGTSLWQPVSYVSLPILSWEKWGPEVLKANADSMSLLSSA